MKIDRAWQKRSLLCLPPFKFTEERGQKWEKKQWVIQRWALSFLTIFWSYLPCVPSRKFWRVSGLGWWIFDLYDAGWALFLHFLIILVGIGDEESDVYFQPGILLWDASSDPHLQWQAVPLGLHTLYTHPLLYFFSVARIYLTYYRFSYFVSLLFVSLYQSGGRKNISYLNRKNLT